MNKLLVLTALGLFLAVHVAVAPVDRPTGHCPSACGAVRLARSARYEAGCSLAAALALAALARAWQRITGSLDRLSNACRCRAFSGCGSEKLRSARSKPGGAKRRNVCL